MPPVAVAIIYDAQGGHVRSQPLGKMPELVLVDSEVIAQSDVRPQSGHC